MKMENRKHSGAGRDVKSLVVNKRKSLAHGRSVHQHLIKVHK